MGYFQVYYKAQRNQTGALFKIKKKEQQKEKHNRIQKGQLE